jgi:glycosyltransferase involved in cell wall biosynthesis
MFVHMRCVEMQKQGQSIVVYVPGDITKKYIQEGVSVKVMPSVEINKELNNYDILYLHLLNIYPFKKSNGWLIYKHILNENIPFVMYVHGSEVQKYGARMFEFNYKLTDFLKWFKKDALVIPKMKMFVRKTMQRNNTAFIFPSVWMKNDLEKNLNITLKQFYIIPNGIDTNLFKFNELYNRRFKLLTLRPLSSKKYAVDLAIEIMQYLPENFSLEIYGKGHYEKQYQKQIQQLNLQQRVHIKNSFIDRADLNNFFSNYGVFLVPTRMDAQGVSMCEAMSSGLLTVSSNNTAIPEFIENLKNGIIGNDLKEVAKNLIKTVESQNQYKKITTKGRASMENIDITITVNRELSLLNKVASFNE